MRHEARLTFEYDSPERARRVERAIAPEAADLANERGRTRVSCSGRTLELTVEATDQSALRAGLNTWLALVTVAEQTGRP